MKTLLAPALAILALSAPARQPSDRDAVLATAEKVFQAMRTRDTTLLLQISDSSAELVGSANRNGAAVLTHTSMRQFGAAVSRAKAGDVWNERMYDPEVRIDGTIAQVWGYYTFHLNSTFSHCGIDAFMLVKVGDAWKITQISDSRRTEGCTHT